MITYRKKLSYVLFLGLVVPIAVFGQMYRSENQTASEMAKWFVESGASSVVIMAVLLLAMSMIIHHYVGEKDE